jgi:DNA-binding MurR/RpiR family transcriptional regulator
MFQDRIRKNYEELTPGFRKLADFIMSSTLDAAFLTATQLSRRVGVDPATVVRFAQELGYSGYRELSREIKHYVRDQVTDSYRQVGEGKAIEKLLKDLEANAQQNIQNFVTTEMAQTVEAVQVLKQAPFVWLTGEFTGYDIASFLEKKLKTYGIPASVFHPSMEETASTLFQMQVGEILLAIVETEPSLGTAKAIQLAKEKGLKTIAISSGVISAAQTADITVSVPIESPVEAPSFSVLIQVLDMIW